jgi:hypothetical protein
MRGRSLESQDRHGELEQGVLVDLKQLVARIGLEHVVERLARMAAGVEPGALDDPLGLASDIGNPVRIDCV